MYLIPRRQYGHAVPHGFLVSVPQLQQIRCCMSSGEKPHVKLKLTDYCSKDQDESKK